MGSVLRESLWQAKEALVRVLVRRGYADALHARLQQQLAGATLVIDVGANDGQYARLCRRLGFRGRIISFEPLPELFLTVQEQARRDGNWLTMPCALGAVDGTLPLNVMAEDVFSSFLKPSDFGQAAFRESTMIERVVMVPLRRLDAVVAELGLDLAAEGGVHLKTDTQGFDIQVMRGAVVTLEHVASIQCELSMQQIYHGQQQWMETAAEIEEHGFSLAGMFAVARDRRQRIIEADALFTRLAKPFHDKV